MGYRDKSQGFGFVYVNVKELLEGKDAAEKAPSANFNKDTSAPTTSPVELTPPTAPNPSSDEVRNNLDRLQNLHRKLHLILEELNSATGRNKK